MRFSPTRTATLVCFLVLLGWSDTSLAQPNMSLPPTYGMSDQKPGSVLFYTMYSSHVVWPHLENTRINLTNTHPSQMAYVHLFFVDSVTCQSADSFVCLTPNQTFSFVVSDYDPGITGYLLAVAVDEFSGLPRQFNYLIGNYYLKLLSGYSIGLGAEAFAALQNPPAVINPDGATVEIKFDDVHYNAGPRVLALNGVPSRLDGNDTLLIVTRLGGNLAGGEGSSIGGILGLTYDDLEKSYSFTMAGGKCQYRGSLTDNNPRMVPRFSSIIKAGHMGWMKLWPAGDFPIVGALINFNASAGTSVSAFSGGVNLYPLSLTTTGSFTLPVFIPTC